MDLHAHDQTFRQNVFAQKHARFYTVNKMLT